MTLEEVWSHAREVMAPNCRACKVCNGAACRGEIPGVGAVGDGSSWTVCTEFLKNVKLNMDTVYDFHGIDTALDMFGRTWKYPIFIAPIGGMGYNYNDRMDIWDYSMMMAEGAKRAGILCFTGDGFQPDQFDAGVRAAGATGQNAVIMKPFFNDQLLPRVPRIVEAGCVAFGCDIDAAGFSNMGSARSSIGPKSVEQLRELTGSTDIPFILKGVMTPAGAEKAAKAGCAAIIVSTHGGRVMPSAPATCEVLPEIRRAVGDSIRIIVDGGIRSGADIFKALALGADAAMIGRPFVVAGFGGGPEGIALYADKLGGELRDVMLLCGAQSLSEIDASMVRLPK